MNKTFIFRRTSLIVCFDVTGDNYSDEVVNDDDDDEEESEGEEEVEEDESESESEEDSEEETEQKGNTKL